MSNYGFTLVGHLQVMEEPLSSLYVDKQTDTYYLTVRTFVKSEEPIYMISQVDPSIVVAYMEHQIGLRSIFEANAVFEYKKLLNHPLCTKEITPVDKKKVSALLDNDFVEDLFNESLAYKSYALKKYLLKINKPNILCHV